MLIHHDKLAEIYVFLMNKTICELPEFEDGMELINIGSGISLIKNGVPVPGPISSGMLSRADKIVRQDIDDHLRSIFIF